MAIRGLKKKREKATAVSGREAELQARLDVQAVAIEKLSRLVDGAQVRYDAMQGELASLRMQLALQRGVTAGLQAVLDELGERARPWFVDHVDEMTGEVTKVQVAIVPQGKGE